MRTSSVTFQEVLLPPAARAAQGACQPLPAPPALLGCAPGALAVLRHLAVAVIACGSVGGRIAVLLARLGLGALYLVDPKNYKSASLATHEIGPEDVGKPKALLVARRCKAISPGTRVYVFVGPVEALDLSDLVAVDLFVTAPDLLAVEVFLGQRAMWLGRPLVQASVHGETLTAQIRFFQNANAQGACPACLYGRAEWDALSRQARFSCEAARSAVQPAASNVPAATPAKATDRRPAEPAAVATADRPATNSLSALCSLAADLAVLQIVRYFLKLGQPVADHMLQYCGFTHRTLLNPLAHHPQCQLDHTAFNRVAVATPLAGLSLAQVAQAATGTSLSPTVQFEVGGMDWVELGACRCAQPAPVRQFVGRVRPRLSRCAACATPIVPLGFYTHRTVSASVLGSAVDQPLGKLGVRRAESVTVRTGAAGALVRHQPQPQETA
jgi:molybdopterin/thiamine biosynthesis adenylyltransferase